MDTGRRLNHSSVLLLKGYHNEKNIRDILIDGICPSYYRNWIYAQASGFLDDLRLVIPLANVKDEFNDI